MSYNKALKKQESHEARPKRLIRARFFGCTVVFTEWEKKNIHEQYSHLNNHKTNPRSSKESLARNLKYLVWIDWRKNHYVV